MCNLLDPASSMVMCPKTRYLHATYIQSTHPYPCTCARAMSPAHLLPPSLSPLQATYVSSFHLEGVTVIPALALAPCRRLILCRLPSPSPLPAARALSVVRQAVIPRRPAMGARTIPRTALDASVARTERVEPRSRMISRSAPSQTLSLEARRQVSQLSRLGSRV